MSKRVLFFDLAVSGHHVEYLYHLINYRAMRPDGPEFILLTHPEFTERAANLKLPDRWHEKGVRVVHPSPEEMRNLERKGSVFSRVDREFRILFRNAEKYGTSCCYLMTLNQFQFVLGKSYARRFPCALRGILFYPYPAMDFGGGYGDRYRMKARRFRKHLQMVWMLRNQRIERIYLLNDPDSASYLNARYNRRDLFVPLVDPVLVPPGYSRLADGNRGSSRQRFLLFGSLSSRKGIFQVLDALRYVPDAVAGRMEMLFAGTVADEDRPRFRSEIAHLCSERPEIRVVCRDEFIPYEDIPGLFSETDCVLLPYAFTIGASSGVIGHSALYGKAVIGPARGLVGRLIRRHGLGVGIDPVNARNIAAAITGFVTGGAGNVNRDAMNKFVQESRPENFAATLLDS